MDVSSVTSTAASAKNGASLASLSETFDNFLLLLTKQLEHQDPLSPLDTNQFTQQLVAFTGVEQQIAMNRKLDDLISLQLGNHAIGALSFMNTSVEAASDRIWMADGAATVTYDLSRQAQLAQLVIRNESGQIVRTVDLPTQSGPSSYEWDGTDDSGADLPAGIYQIDVVAVDDEGAPIAASTGFRGTVTGVELDGGDISLSIGDLIIPIGKVHKISNPPAA
jgi:flagellar basal-body rod modification protein FlgD